METPGKEATRKINLEFLSLSPSHCGLAKCLPKWATLLPWGGGGSESSLRVPVFVEVLSVCLKKADFLGPER